MKDMPKNIQIRDVPDDVHRVLIQKATRAGQSLQEFLQARLREVANAETNMQVFARIEALMREHPEEFVSGDVDVAAVIREDRESH